MNRFEQITDEKFIEVFKLSESKGDVLRKLNLVNNGTSMRYVNKMMDKLNLPIDILKDNYFNNYHTKKICPVCGKEFITKIYNSDKVCCSYACSNTYFRSGKNNGMSKLYKDNFQLSAEDEEKYRQKLLRERQYQQKIKEERKKNRIKSKEHVAICFKYHPHKCCVCGEENIVAAHHYDENHFNNDPTNFIPLCPTHHSYMHSHYKELINDIVEEYHKNFLEKYNK